MRLALATFATVLAVAPAPIPTQLTCPAGQWLSITSTGQKQCSEVTAVAFAVNGANCAAGNAPLGVDAAGAVESCFDVATQTELNTHTGATSVHGATAASTADRIVLRDGSGNFAAGTITGALSGNASTATALVANGANCAAGTYPLGVDAVGAAESCGSNINGNAATATALAADPADCGANTFAQSIAASGALTCAALGDADVPNGITIDLAATATALAANPADCGASTFATAIDASGNLTCAAAGGGLTKFTEAESTSAPNATVYVDSLTAAAASTNADVAFVAKGSGATLAQVPDGTAAGGNKRGAYATDWQKSRSAATQVAGTNYSTIGGGYANTVSSIYGTVAGGRNNSAGPDSAVGGGYANNAVNNYSTIGGGYGNYSGGNYSTVAGGFLGSATAANSTVGGGQQAVASGSYSTASGGYRINANGDYSTIPGGKEANARSVFGRFSYASGQFASEGDAQMGIHVTRRSTTDATTTRLTANAGAPSTINVNVLPNAHAYMVRAEVVARQNTTGDAKAWVITALVKRGASAADTFLVGAPTVTVIGADAGAAAWTANLVADTTRGSIEIEVVGEAGDPIRWVGTMYTTEVGG